MENDETNNPGTGQTGQNGSAPGGDNRQASTGGGNPRGDGTPSSSISADQLDAIIQKATAPLVQKIESLQNLVGARRRTAGRRAENTRDDQADNGTADDFATMSKEDMARELRDLKAAERARQDREKSERVQKTVREGITAGKFVNADLLERLILPNARPSATGDDVVFDDGRKVVPIADIIREFGSRDIFQPASTGGGSNAAANADNPAGIVAGGKVLTDADIETMSDEEFAKMAAAVKNQGTKF